MTEGQGGEGRRDGLYQVERERHFLRHKQPAHNQPAHTGAVLVVRLSKLTRPYMCPYMCPYMRSDMCQERC